MTLDERFPEVADDGCCNCRRGHETQRADTLRRAAAELEYLLNICLFATPGLELVSKLAADWRDLAAKEA